MPNRIKILYHGSAFGHPYIFGNRTDRTFSETERTEKTESVDFPDIPRDAVTPAEGVQILLIPEEHHFLKAAGIQMLKSGNLLRGTDAAPDHGGCLFRIIGGNDFFGML